MVDEIPTPGCNRLTISSPRRSEMIEAETNQPIVFAPIRPTVAASPIWPMPTTRVDSTSGPMIILMSFKKTELTSDMSLAISAAVALSGNS
jgi:hypothetical protein